MKILIFVILSLFLALVCGIVPTSRPGHKKQHMLGEKECTYGPTFWCQNLTNAGDCHATKHCIQTVWLHKQYPVDTSNICDTCKEMVKEARDQLESNETQELIKEVFEGSCALLRLKPIVKECDKIADDYIPDLIDTLASEMNPQTVCAIAGLCNNPRIQELLELSKGQISKKPTEVAPRNRCDDCNTVMDIAVKKFNGMKRDDFLESLLEVCGKFGSLSDACSNTVIKYFSDIYSYLKGNFNADDFCLLSGECYRNFHKHEVEITPMSKIGYVHVDNENDDLPCELCEQLVNHLREVLVANTTEIEFKQILEGLCKETKQSFRKECLSVVDQYYDLIYGYVVDGLNATATCQLIGICPTSFKNRPLIAPLLPVDTAAVASSLSRAAGHIYIPKDDIVVKVIQTKQPSPILSPQEMQLPIDLLVPPHQQLYNKEFCVFCEYFLHYVQNAITDPAVEDEVKKVVDEACSKLPISVNKTCVEFVDNYEPALVAILAQEIDPSQVCPLIKACPSEEVKDVEIFMRATSSANCPLCLYAVTELEALVKGDKSKKKIQEALDEVCDKLPGSLKPECTDFVNTYTNELIEMLIADFKPQEVCVYLKLCTDTTPVSEVELTEIEYVGGDTETNAIYDDTVNGHPVQHLGDEKCVLCEFVMKEIDDQLKDKTTDDEIKSIVHEICKALPGTIKDECNKFVDQYADAVIILLEEAMEPTSICSYLKFCTSKFGHPLEYIRLEASKCGVCRSAADIIQTILKNPKIDQSVEHIFEKTCRGMSSDSKKTCENITNESGIALVALLARGDSELDAVCRSLKYCGSTEHFPVIN